MKRGGGGYVSEEHTTSIFRVKNQLSKKPAEVCFHAGFLIGLFFNPEDGGFL
jgi:hypothetical protein